MYHQVYWTPQKIAQRLALISPLVYRQRQALPPFGCITLSSPHEEPPVGTDIDDSQWETISPNSYWGTWTTDFVLRTRFQVPAGWNSDQPVGLYLPIGSAGD